MKKLISFVFAASTVLALSSTPALAHHGYAAYDETKLLSLKGTVTDFELANPHSTMSFDVKDEHGKVDNWVAEAGHIRLMQDEGWTRSTLKPGDVVTFYYHPAKNGSHAVDLVKVVLPDGRALWAHSSHDQVPTDKEK
jgi:phenylpropionate dioxygenase-like ring-hydroxylating dioxygenase large terminal subunit